MKLLSHRFVTETRNKTLVGISKNREHVIITKRGDVTRQSQTVHNSICKKATTLLDAISIRIGFYCLAEVNFHLILIIHDNE